jgi:hypothetical protein
MAAPTTPAPAPRTTGSNRTPLIITAIVALAVGGVIGLAAGWKIEQSRVKDDVKNVRPVGTVTAVDDGSVTIDLVTASGTRTYTLSDATVVEQADRAEAADITEGAKILVKSNGEQASEIIVLSDATTFGGGG